jgi:hypothetical protein
MDPHIHVKCSSFHLTSQPVVACIFIPWPRWFDTTSPSQRPSPTPQQHDHDSNALIKCSGSACFLDHAHCLQHQEQDCDSSKTEISGVLDCYVTPQVTISIQMICILERDLHLNMSDRPLKIPALSDRHMISKCLRCVCPPSFILVRVLSLTTRLQADL